MGLYLFTVPCLPPLCLPCSWRWCSEASKYQQSSYSPVGLMGAEKHWQGTSPTGLQLCAAAARIHLPCWSERQGAAPALGSPERSFCCKVKAMDCVMALLTETTRYVESLNLCRDSFLALDGCVLLCY